MAMPKAYDPQQGYMYQFLYLGPGEREYDHLDYATDKADKRYLLGEYSLMPAYIGRIRVITLPRKYWKPEEGQIR